MLKVLTFKLFGESFSFLDQNYKNGKETEALIRSFVSIQQCTLGTCFFKGLPKLTVN